MKQRLASACFIIALILMIAGPVWWAFNAELTLMQFFLKSWWVAIITFVLYFLSFILSDDGEI